MNCPVCGANNAPGSKFCIGCGGALPAVQASPAMPMAPTMPVAPPAAPAAPVAPVAPAQPQPAAKMDVNNIKNQIGDSLQPVTEKAKSAWGNKTIRLGIIGGVVLLLAVIIIAIFAGKKKED